MATTRRPLEDLYSFQERRFTAYNHSVRVFIHGADVSAWLKGSVTVNYHGREGFNSASFELENPHKIFQFTLDDLVGETLTGAGEYSAAAKAAIYELKNDLNDSPAYPLKNVLIQQGVFNSNVKATATAAGVAAKNGFLDPGPLQERRYRMALNDCIFNKHDWVRIFIKNPFSASADQWVEVFCGFVQEHPITTNHLTGQSKVAISCGCIKQQLSKMRVQTSVHKADVDPQVTITEGFYKDFFESDTFTHPFAISSLEDTIKTLILGASIFDEDHPSDRRVGQFKLGNIVCYDPVNPGNALERWHLMTTFGVNKVPFPTGGGLDDMWLTTQEMVRIGRATYAASEQNVTLPVGGPQGRYLHMLLPISGSGPNELIQWDYFHSGDAAQAREWTTRWEIIRDFASKLDFQVMTSPSGDILLEFPQYGFTPCAYLTNFGSETPLSASNTDTLTPKPFLKCEANIEGHMANMFVFNKHQKEETLNDEAEDFPTILQVGGGFAWNQLNVQQQISVLAPRAYVYSPVLVARYGVISESVDFPYAGQRAKDLGTANSALTRRLGQLGLVEYTKRMADASNWQGSLVYRPFLFPNRPIELKKSERIGLITNVTYTWNVGQDASMTVACNMLMAKRFNTVGNNIELSYRLLTGAVNTPIDYGAVWSGGSGGSSGINTAGIGHLGEMVPQTADSGITAVVAALNAGTGDAGSTTVAKAQAASQSIKIPSAQLAGLFPPFAELLKSMFADLKGGNVNAYISSTPGPEAAIDIRAGIAVDVDLQDGSGASSVAIDTDQVTGKSVAKNAGTVQNLERIASAARTQGLGVEERVAGNFRAGWHITIPPAWHVPSSLSTDIFFLAKSNKGFSDNKAAKLVWKVIKGKNPDLNFESKTIPVPQNLKGVIASLETKGPFDETAAIAKQLASEQAAKDQNKTPPGDLASKIGVVSPCKGTAFLTEPGLTPLPT